MQLLTIAEEKDRAVDLAAALATAATAAAALPLVHYRDILCHPGVGSFTRTLKDVQLECSWITQI